jgi:hypothetical protein
MRGYAGQLDELAVKLKAANQNRLDKLPVVARRPEQSETAGAILGANGSQFPGGSRRNGRFPVAQLLKTHATEPVG